MAHIVRRNQFGLWWAVEILALGLCFSPPSAILSSVLIFPSGDCKKWEPVAISFSGPTAKSEDNTPNPFLDYRLQVMFSSPDGKTYVVPGFYDGDGQGGRMGNVWRVLFSPDETGCWSFRASFRKGPEVAVSLDPAAGEALSFDGREGRFVVVPQDKNAPGFLKWGRLEYVGKFYLKFRDGGYWIKGGTDEPENFLGYVGFANTPQGKHRYEHHLQDWRPGDPDWEDGKGRPIIGALNYLSSQHMNNLYFLPMNIGGDGQDVWPYLGRIDPRGSPENDNLHFDVLKLRQWDIVLSHAQRSSIFLHFVLNEAERANKLELDNSSLGVERKLYYREMVARFGHHLALQWNLCEEYDLDLRLAPDLNKSYAEFIHEIDPYDHPITVHHASRDIQKVWGPFLGFGLFPVTSFQTRDTSTVEMWRKASRKAGFLQVVSIDEFYPDTASAENADRHRREYTWPIYLSGGQLEYITQDLIATEDFRKYESNWRYTWYARKFLEENLPFWEMEPMDNLLTRAATYKGNSTVSGQVFAKPGEVYAVYVPVGEKTGTLDLSGAPGKLVQRWYNPRTGEFEGAAYEVEGCKPVELGSPPKDVSEDWAILIRRERNKR